MDRPDRSKVSGPKLVMKNFLCENIAYVIWADDKILDDEWLAAKNILKKYNLNWEEGKSLIQGKINDLIECVENESEEEAEEENEALDSFFDEDFEIENNLLPEGIDEFELLKDLTSVALADGELSYGELDIIHRLGKSFGASEIMITAAILEVVNNSKIKISMALSDN